MSDRVELVSEFKAPNPKYPSLNQVMMEFIEGRKTPGIPKYIGYFNKQIKKRDKMPVEYIVMEYMLLHHFTPEKVGKFLNFPFPEKILDFSERLRSELVEPTKGELEVIWRHGQYEGKND